MEWIFVARARFRPSTHPLFSGARPAVLFDGAHYTSEIHGLADEFFPANKWIDLLVRVPFISRPALVGTKFLFTVGARELGEGVVASE